MCISVGPELEKFKKECWIQYLFQIDYKTFKKWVNFILCGGLCSKKLTHINKVLKVQFYWSMFQQILKYCLKEYIFMFYSVKVSNYNGGALHPQLELSDDVFWVHCRSYYRCTQDNCRVKKRVERLAEDPRMVITTYEGRHVHSPSNELEDSQSPSELSSFLW